MKPICLFIVALVVLVLNASAGEKVAEDQRIVISYDFEFNFFTKLEKSGGRSTAIVATKC